VYQHSRDDTDEEYENLLSKIERYCKSLTLIKESKIDLARAKTKPRLNAKSKDKKDKKDAKSKRKD